MSTIKLVSSDNWIFDVSVELLECSGLLKDFALTSEPDEAIPLPTVSGPILEKILEWAAHHRYDCTSGNNEVHDNNENKAQWERNFFEFDSDTMFHLILAANYLDIKDLMSDLCRIVAADIRGEIDIYL